MVASIKALDESVVNKIAAGEIIISPVNALKEMMENSIDAGAKSLDILVRDGGIKLLQVTDNGCGINREDLPVLCERFTTSKLTKFEDLESIATYGFRGEALASISHIARVTVTTKTQDDKCAWRVSYAEGKMIGEPRPMAGRDGTVILVEDLFYNMPSRLQALRSPGEEYTKILDVVGRYAIHRQDVAFSCKKFGDSQFSLTIRSDLSAEGRIRTVFGNAVAKSLLAFDMASVEELDIAKVSGQVSNLEFNFKKSITPVLFINDRLVTCNPLARALRQVYANFLPKGNKPFIYLSLLINPKVLDVNVHPTKREVRFLHQDEIIEKIALQLNEVLSKVDTSRTFKASTVLTSKPVHSASISRVTATSSINKSYQNNNNGQTQNGQTPAKRYENKLVRTDASQAKITTFLKSSQSQATSPAVVLQTIDRQEINENHSEGAAKENLPIPSSPAAAVIEKSSKYQIHAQERIEVNLSSIKRLREAVDESIHRDLTDAFANLTFVGVVDVERRLATIQHDLKLFLIDYGAVCYELFYQICLSDFSNYGKIILESANNKGLRLIEILSSFEHLTDDFILGIVQRLWDMREMLTEYFAIELTAEGDTDKPAQESIQLRSIPLLLKDYTPPLAKIPFFIYRLGTRVNWEVEEPCLEGIMRQIALLYIPEIIELVDLSGKDVDEERKAEFVARNEEMSYSLENVVFPCIKRRFLAPRSLSKDVIEIANLPGLYKVFERC
ncbi:hypothetical protein HG536_0A02690 [Torulaspora globosa]|uniref:DNA mismatch repair protein S5 domain-containing protein n=1 Tax=Torulaspora globosa TaxID=48254 RepID=A0A7G3ZAB6_9SACH|nr:uncharacterized protein HG536_0A02690 [Torulaspora globosa]QLL30452.1 hypothetical protein HG536_0A02690 [Torulaspora globosa]